MMIKIAKNGGFKKNTMNKSYNFTMKESKTK